MSQEHTANDKQNAANNCVVKRSSKSFWRASKATDCVPLRRGMRNTSRTCTLSPLTRVVRVVNKRASWSPLVRHLVASLYSTLCTLLAPGRKQAATSREPDCLDLHKCKQIRRRNLKKGAQFTDLFNRKSESEREKKVLKWRRQVHYFTELEKRTS